MNANQRRVLAEILGNMAIVWYAAAVVPVFLLSNEPKDYRVLVNFLIGVIMTIAHIQISLDTAK